jgi:hypothetical protein
MITFTVFGIIFLGLGIVLYAMSNQIDEVTVKSYDDNKLCSGSLPNTCSITLEITTPIKAPIYVYY